MDILKLGLLKVGYDTVQQEWVSVDKNKEIFKSFYGSSPSVVTAIWDDLLKTSIPRAKIKGSATNLHHFFLALYLLKCYPTENAMAGIFNIGGRLIGEKAWTFVEKLQALKEKKVSLVFALYLSICYF